MSESAGDLTFFYIIVGASIVGIVSGLTVLASAGWAFLMWLQTRSYPPKAGQVWNQHGYRLYVIGLTDTGRVRLRSYEGDEPTEWDESPANWKERVRRGHLYLMGRESERFRKSLGL